jgi:recombinational DNA repair ATPase RecF
MAVEMGCRWALRHISIENFKSVTKAELTIAAQTFHLVTGPNGSGKSNLFEAIAFGLGQPVTASVFRVGTLEELAGSDHRDSRVCVDLVFERQSLAASMPSNHSKTDASVNNDTTTTKASSSSRRGIGVRPKACSSAGEGRLGVGSRYVAGNREYLINGAKVSRAR